MPINPTLSYAPTSTFSHPFRRNLASISLSLRISATSRVKLISSAFYPATRRSVGESDPQGDKDMSFWNKLFGYGSTAKTPRKSTALDSTLEAAGYKRTMTRPTDEKSVVDSVVQAMLARQSCLEESLFETGEKNPQRILCSDNECPCTDQKPLIIGRTAYLYISQGVVDFRRTCLTLLEREIQLQQYARKFGDAALIIDGGVANPFYLCKTGATRRGLDLSIALADAVRVAETGFAPLRPTPRTNGAVQVQIESFGIYQAEVKQVIANPNAASGYSNETGRISFIKQTDRIPLRKGLTFGLDILPVGQAKGRPVRLRYAWRFPPPGLKNPETGKTRLYDEIPREFVFGESNIIVYSFDAEFEMLPGQWLFEIWDGEKKLAEKVFIVETFSDNATEEPTTLRTPQPNSSTPNAAPTPTPAKKSARPTDEKSVVAEVKDMLRAASGALDFIARAKRAGFHAVKEDFIGLHLQKGECTLNSGCFAQSWARLDLVPLNDREQGRGDRKSR